MLCLLFGVLFCDVSHLLYHNFQQIARECRIFRKKGAKCRIDCKIRAAGNEKVFRCSSFSKMLPRCGRAAHICEANLFLKFVFPAAIACFKTFKFRQSCIMRIKVVSSDKATGQLQHAGRQKQGWNPLLPDAKDRFS